MFRCNALFEGNLLHRRYTPVRHELEYRTTDVLVDVDKLDELNGSSWILGYNTARILTINDRNHGAADGTPISVHVRRLMDGLKLERPVRKIYMLCYPAVLGRVFNPLTVYFGLEENGTWCAAVYEVRNTFGARHSYVMAVNSGTSHRADKCFDVSPYNNVEGEYQFSIERHEPHLRINIALFVNGKLKLAARFTGMERRLSDTALLKALLGLVIQPAKVVVAIHWEALKLYLKGLRPTPRPRQRLSAAMVSDEKNMRKIEA